ncbi:MAG TPA: orotidine-5'-phosphate decarboxylase [Phycisphaerae bacterium]|jgi:orotidine-5'-phosphate decarboxylase
MSENFADRLLAAIRRKGTPTCVGIDPEYQRLPADIADHQEMNDATDTEASLDAVLEFSRRVIRIVAPLVPAVKINIAFFERYYGEGVDGYFDLVQEAAEHDLIVIGDVKRADIGHSSAAYAEAHLADPAFANLEDRVAPDAVTVNPYFGLDAIKPFLQVARAEQKGVFALVQTSNETWHELQGLKLETGLSVSERVATLVNAWASEPGMIGNGGFSVLGAVVSPRDPESTVTLRAMLPHSFFLVPGYGTQGRDAAAIAPCFKSDGTGALVTASRSVIYAYEDMKYIERFTSEWEACIEQACRDFIADLGKAIPHA